MQEKNLIFSFEEKKCKVEGQKGKIETFRIDEVLPNGSKINVATEIRFRSEPVQPLHEKLLRLFQRNGRRAA